MLLDCLSRGLEELDRRRILRLLAQRFDPHLGHREFRYRGARALRSSKGLQRRPRPQQELPDEVPLVLLSGVVLHRQFEALEHVRRDVRPLGHRVVAARPLDLVLVQPLREGLEGLVVVEKSVHG